MLRKSLLTAAATACFLLPTAAQAQGPWYGPIAGGYGGFDAGYVYPFFYRVRSIPTPPYFALHPPVYYGPRLIMRPYGNSPFAYPSWYERQAFVPFATPAAETANVAPLMIYNPYVPQDRAPEAPATETSRRHQSNASANLKLVLNPHLEALK